MVILNTQTSCDDLTVTRAFIIRPHQEHQLSQRPIVSILAPLVVSPHLNKGLNKGAEPTPGSPPCPHLIVSPLARSHLASLTVRFSVFLLHNGLFHFNTPQDGLSPTGGKTVTVQNNAGGWEVQRLIAAAFGAVTFRCVSGCCL